MYLMYNLRPSSTCVHYSRACIRFQFLTYVHYNIDTGKDKWLKRRLSVRRFSYSHLSFPASIYLHGCNNYRDVFCFTRLDTGKQKDQESECEKYTYNYNNHEIYFNQSSIDNLYKFST